MRRKTTIRPVLLLAAATAALASAPTLAQDRIRISIGPELTPAYPGADRYSPSPFFDFSRAKGDENFDYEAPDESFGFPILSAGDVYIGPTLAFVDKRDEEDTVPGLHTVGTTVEAGASVQWAISDRFYAFSEIRKGLGGHKGWAGTLGADHIWRSGDDWLVSLGPRVTWGDGRQADAYFGISPEEAVATGLPAFDADGGIQSVGGAAGLHVSLSKRWGFQTYAGYRRMIGDAANSPVVRNFGSRNAFAGGVAISYKFTRGE